MTTTGWMPHRKKIQGFCKRLHYVGAMQITIDYWLWAHMWKWKNSTWECQSTGITKAQVQCIHTCATRIRLHHREHTMPFFSQSPAEELCSGMHYFSCVGFSSSVASILLAIVRKYAHHRKLICPCWVWVWGGGVVLGTLLQFIMKLTGGGGGDVALYNR
jgi:hypothetical protein